MDNIVEWLRMTDWKKIAEAEDLKMDETALGVAVSRLAGLEQQLAAQLPGLSTDDDPAVTFDAARIEQ